MTEIKVSVAVPMEQWHRIFNESIEKCYQKTKYLPEEEFMPAFRDCMKAELSAAKKALLK